MDPRIDARARLVLVHGEPLDSWIPQGFGGDLDDFLTYIDPRVILLKVFLKGEAAPSSEIPISGAPACDRLHPIIFGRSQILPSRPLFTVAYLIQ